MDFLFERFASNKSAIAYVDETRSFTYGDMLEKIDSYGKILEEKGVKPAQVVMLIGQDAPEVFFFVLALLKNGNTVAPITLESAVELDTVMALSENRWTVEFSADAQDISFTETDCEPSNPMLVDFLSTGAPGVLVFSSGTSGIPKAILHNFLVVAAKFEKPRKPITAIAFLMLDHFGGINTLVSITSSLGTVVAIRSRSVAETCRAIEKHKVELLPTTPSFLTMLVHSDLAERFDLSSLNLISYGTEIMPQTTLDKLGRKFPNVKLQQTYGLSEVGVLRSQSRPDGSLWVRIGGEGFQTKVVDETLRIKSDFAMVGYLNEEVPFDEEGWFDTQDRVEVNGEYFRFLGRTSDLINIGGQKVYPAEIEEIILDLENINDVVVVGEKNNLLGNIVVARVVTKEEETPGSLKKRIRKVCAERLAAFKVPSKVVLADKALFSERMKKVR